MWINIIYHFLFEGRLLERLNIGVLLSMWKNWCCWSFSAKLHFFAQIFLLYLLIVFFFTFPPRFLFKMSSKQPISPILFWTVEGEPMTFFLRPGPVKRQLQPLITSGGGILSKVQKPGAILLIDPDEKISISASDAHRWVLDIIENIVQTQEWYGKHYLYDWYLFPLPVMFPPSTSMTA